MPVSRKRNKKAGRRDKRRAARAQRRTVVATVRPGQDLEPLLTKADHQAMWAAVDAAARGDAEACWQHLLEGLLVLETLHHHKVREIALLADQAPGWMYSRWAVDQAYRFLLLTEDPRSDVAVRTTMSVAGHLDHVLALGDDPDAVREYGTLVAASDWVCQQFATFELGGLRDFIDDRALAGLLDRCDRIRGWVDAAMGAYVLEEGAGPVVVVHDLVHDDRLEVLNLGALADRGHGETVLGRLVPISEEPGLMFESRPLSVPEETAYAAAGLISSGDPWGWLDALEAAAEEGLVHAGFSCGQDTLYSSDIVPESTCGEQPTPRDEMPGRMREDGWRILAAHTSSVVRARCEALAEACAVPRAS